MPQPDTDCGVTTSPPRLGNSAAPFQPSPLRQSMTAPYSCSKETEVAQVVSDTTSPPTPTAAESAAKITPIEAVPTPTDTCGKPLSFFVESAVLDATTPATPTAKAMPQATSTPVSATSTTVKSIAQKIKFKDSLTGKNMVFVKEADGTARAYSCGDDTIPINGIDAATLMTLLEEAEGFSARAPVNRLAKDLDASLELSEIEVPALDDSTVFSDAVLWNAADETGLTPCPADPDQYILIQDDAHVDESKVTTVVDDNGEKALTVRVLSCHVFFADLLINEQERVLLFYAPNDLMTIQLRIPILPQVHILCESDFGVVLKDTHAVYIYIFNPESGFGTFKMDIDDELRTYDNAVIAPIQRVVDGETVSVTQVTMWNSLSPNPNLVSVIFYNKDEDPQVMTQSLCSNMTGGSAFYLQQVCVFGTFTHYFGINEKCSCVSMYSQNNIMVAANMCVFEGDLKVKRIVQDRHRLSNIVIHFDDGMLVFYEVADKRDLARSKACSGADKILDFSAGLILLRLCNGQIYFYRPFPDVDANAIPPSVGERVTEGYLLNKRVDSAMFVDRGLYSYISKVNMKSFFGSEISHCVNFPDIFAMIESQNKTFRNLRKTNALFLDRIKKMTAETVSLKESLERSNAEKDAALLISKTFGEEIDSVRKKNDELLRIPDVAENQRLSELIRQKDSFISTKLGEIAGLNYKIELFTAQVQAAKDVIAELEKEREEGRRELHELQKNHERAMNKLRKAHEKTIKKFQADKDAALNSIENELVSVSKTNDDLRTRIDELMAQAEDNVRVMKTSFAQAVERERLFAQRTAEVTELERALKNKNKELADLNRELRLKTETITRVESDLAQSTQANEAERKRLTLLAEKAESDAAHLAKVLKVRDVQLQDAIKAHQEEIKDVEVVQSKRCSDTMVTLEAMKGRLEEEKKTSASLRERVAELEAATVNVTTTATPPPPSPPSSVSSETMTLLNIMTRELAALREELGFYRSEIAALKIREDSITKERNQYLANWKHYAAIVAASQTMGVWDTLILRIQAVIDDRKRVQTVASKELLHLDNSIRALAGAMSMDCPL